jgi:hypothetical protein
MLLETDQERRTMWSGFMDGRVDIPSLTDLTNSEVDHLKGIVRANHGLADAMNLRGTPSFLFMDKNGNAAQRSGAPADIASLIAHLSHTDTVANRLGGDQ